ncbi:MG2 domain-containing protein [Antarcticibacterium sp. 1MA-6-2]|uniref:MG2 domain-containing protein n=1 Tax=Antarcticibacterium sp. 1MA-6-2 TaxID=2908210 RepID=UPI001F1CBD43|nr:MG2 domain-containing protein [Antarcticibacterium sp. 1MA-6-2]UJH92048.1 MG2 domain-containing protein [Antarcticibacterium sp. 1MA-6-2]
MEGVKLEFFNEYSSPSVKYTDKEGSANEVKTKSSSRSGRIRASINGDTLNTNYWPGYFHDYEDEEFIPLAKTLIYLDRAIYRPGQKVFFKGILLKHIKDKTTTVANEYVEIYVDDPNGEEIAYYRLKTNKYGSFNGSFSLPTSGITGEFEIYAEEDTEEESEFWNDILDNGDFGYNSLSFKVEEYKRPTFEVKFDDINETFHPGDTAVVSGSAKSFMGAGISNTNLIYEVTRQKLIRRWWYSSYGDPVTIVVDTTTTDAEGKYQITFPVILEAQEDLNENYLYKYKIKATVVDVTGETREASTSIKIGAQNLLTNLVLPESVITGDTLDLKIENTNLNENPVL